jgi:putative transposase
MPRRRRLEIPGAPHHIVQRGVDKQPTFFDRSSYVSYLHWLREYSQAHRVQVHAWCLMTNHVHLLLTPSEGGGLSRLMQNLNRAYVQKLNYRCQRVGHLWSGRFKAAVISDRAYFFHCMRYIEFNPVRARMVAHPDDYPWSSWHANVGARRSTLISPHTEYLALAGPAGQRQQRYRALMLGGGDYEEKYERIRRATRMNEAV